MKAAPFAYHCPTTADEVAGLLARYGDEAKVIAGGQSLVPILALRLGAFEHLVDLRLVEGLTGIEPVHDAAASGQASAQAGRPASAVRIGAATTQAAIERSEEIAGSVPLLSRATPLIGHLQIRNRGTLGGSLAHADPAAEYPAVVLTLDAQLEVLSPTGPRTIAAADFFEGMWTTAVGDDELLTAVTFPVWAGRCGFAVEELARRHGDFAIAGACVALRLDQHDAVDRCAVGLFGLGATPLRATAAEAAAVGNPADALDADELGRLATEGLDGVLGDVHGPAEYRRRVGAAMVARGWRRAIEEARHG